MTKLKKVALGVAAGAMSIMGTFFAFAETTATDTALQTALTSISSDVTGKLAIVLPIALGIMAVGFGVKWAVKFFKSLANK